MGAVQNSLLSVVGAGAALAMGASKYFKESSSSSGMDNAMAERALQNVAQKQLAKQSVEDRVQARRELRQTTINGVPNTAGEQGKTAAQRALERRRQASNVLKNRKEAE